MNKIMVIEDDADYAGYIQQALKNINKVEIRQTIYGGDLTLVQKELNEIKPDLVILDSLQGDWENVARNIRYSLPETRVCLFTGDSTLIGKIEGNLGEYGLSAVLNKGNQLMSGLPDFVRSTIDGSIKPGNREKL